MMKSRRDQRTMPDEANRLKQEARALIEAGAAELGEALLEKVSGFASKSPFTSQRSILGC